MCLRLAQPIVDQLLRQLGSDVAYHGLLLSLGGGE
jgi:hypothetical protein